MDERLDQRSKMYMTMDSSLLGLAATIFVLILTLKSELLTNASITSQLVLSMPFFIASMLSHAKITDAETLTKYFVFNRVTTAVAFALLLNSLGLIIVHYVSNMIGVLFFAILLIILATLEIMDFSNTRVTTEGIAFVIVVLLGLLPALGVF